MFMAITMYIYHSFYSTYINEINICIHICAQFSTQKILSSCSITPTYFETITLWANLEKKLSLQTFISTKDQYKSFAMYSHLNGACTEKCRAS